MTFEKLRHNFVRKDIVLIIVYDHKDVKYLFERIIDYVHINHKKLDMKCLYGQREIRLNNYKIRFVSSLSFNPRGYRPEIVYWCTNLNDKNYELYEIIQDQLILSSRLESFRRRERDEFILDQDILTNDFKIKDYIDTKSFGYKLTRNKYIHKKWNEFKNKLLHRKR